MNSSVSSRSVLAVASVLSMSICWLLFVLPATGAVSGGLFGLAMLAAATWLGMRGTRSMAQLLRDVHPEPVPVTATSAKSVR